MKLVITANAFSKNEVLVGELKKAFPYENIIFNTSGRYTTDQLIEVLKDADAAIVGLDKIDDNVLKECTKLKIIAKYGVGLDNINLDDCKRNNVQVGWTGGVNKTSVAEMTLGFMLMLMRNLYITSNQLKQDIWNKSGGVQLSGKIVGIIGVGYIGKEVIRLLKPFNCQIMVNDIIDQKEYYTQHGLLETSKEEIFKNADIISIHTPLTDLTRNLITVRELGLMKQSAYVINTARGGIVNENDLKIALRDGYIAGAAIDPFVVEPPTDKEFIKIPNLISTPHIGGNAKEAVEAMGMSAIEHLQKYFKGNG